MLLEMPRPVSDRIMTMRLPLSKNNFTTIIIVYAPTMTNPDENKEAFNNQLASVLSGIPHIDKLLLKWDFDARDRKRKWLVALGHWQTQDWQIQVQWRVSIGSVLRVRTDSDEHHVEADGWTKDHLDASSFQTLASSRGARIRWTFTVPEPCVELTAGPITRCWGQKWLSKYDKSTTGKRQVSRQSSTLQN